MKLISRKILFFQNLSLGLFRSDYFYDCDESSLGGLGIKQVEFNTVASSLGSLVSVVCSAQKYFHYTQLMAAITRVKKCLSKSTYAGKVI